MTKKKRIWFNVFLSVLLAISLTTILLEWVGTPQFISHFVNNINNNYGNFAITNLNSDNQHIYFQNIQYFTNWGVYLVFLYSVYMLIRVNCFEIETNTIETSLSSILLVICIVGNVFSFISLVNGGSYFKDKFEIWQNSNNGVIVKDKEIITDVFATIFEHWIIPVLFLIYYFTMLHSYRTKANISFAISAGVGIVWLIVNFIIWKETIWPFPYITFPEMFDWWEWLLFVIFALAIFYGLSWMFKGISIGIDNLSWKLKVKRIHKENIRLML